MRNEEPAALALNGWTYYDKCRCVGMMKYKYRSKAHPDLELEWWTKYNQFKITYRGSSTKVPLSKVSNMDKILKEL